MIEAVDVEAVGGGARFVERAGSRAARRAPEPPSARTRFFSTARGATRDVFLRDQLALGARVDGPALIIEPHQTIVVEDGWRAEITREEPRRAAARAAPPRARTAVGAKADPVMLEIFNNLFMSIAEQMGVTLQNTAYSVNIKERLDFSCAVFDARRRARRQCAAHAGASGLDGPLGRDDHPPQRRARCAPATCSR